jgi:hypothetical protein
VLAAVKIGLYERIIPSAGGRLPASASTWYVQRIASLLGGAGGSRRKQVTSSGCRVEISVFDFLDKGGNLGAW